MTQVDFYLLKGVDTLQRLTLACRLAEKAYASGQKVFIYCSTDDCTPIDTLLWSFKPESFIPHKVIAQGDSLGCQAPILIRAEKEPDATREVLINLVDEVPYFFSRFKRTLEVINDEEVIKQAARERWNFYKERGYPLNHHPITL